MNIKELIRGGLADKMTLEDVAKKHNISVDELRPEFEMGLKIEMEHTDNKDVASEIALDHLFEKPDYYTLLTKHIE